MSWVLRSPAPAARSLVTRLAMVAGVVASLGCGAEGTAATASAAPVTAAPPPTVATAAPATGAGKAREVRLVSATGSVERKSEAGWVPVKAGDTFSPDEHLRVGAAGLGVLAVGDGVRVEVTELTEITIREVTEVARLRLDEGRVEVDVTGGIVVVESAGGAMVRAENATFAALSSGGGDLSVASRRGTVRVMGKSETVEISAGELTVVESGGEPAAPRPIPASIFLKVTRPEKETAASSVTIHGRTLAGAMINIGEVRVSAGVDGRFSAKVPLGEGENRVVVRATDVEGRTATTRLPSVKRISAGPEIDARTKWGGSPAKP